MNKINKKFEFFIKALVFILLGYFLILFNLFGISEISDKYFQDKLYAISSPLYPEQARDKTLILLINDNSLTALHEQGFFQANEWPILYSDHGVLLATLLKYKPSSLFIDIYFKQERSTDNSAPRLLSMLDYYGLKANIPIMFAGGYPDESLTKFQKQLKNRFELVINGWTSPIGNYPLNIDSQKTVATRLYEITCLNSNANSGCSNISEKLITSTKNLSVRWGSSPAKPIDETLSKNYCEAPSILSYLSLDNIFNDHLAVQCPFHQILHADDLIYIDKYGTSDQKVLLKNTIINRNVLYGANFEGLHDEVLSPVHGKLPGVMYHAMALDNLMVDGEKYLRVSDAFSQKVSLIAWSVIAFFITFLVSKRSEFDDYFNGYYSTFILSVNALLIWLYGYFMFRFFGYEPGHSASFILALLGAVTLGNKLDELTIRLSSIMTSSAQTRQFIKAPCSVFKKPLPIPQLKENVMRLLILGLITWAVFSSQVNAEETQVLSFSFEEVEVKLNGQYKYIESNVIGELPIRVLEENKKGWLKLDSEVSDDLWISKSTVTLNTDKPVIDCKSMAIGKNQHTQQHGTRGAGEGCQ
ncbi:CHASE2 domain-containing protein [Methylophaga nitratireducenticrescens]|uniref:Gliding motility protein GldF n=1 Tax=Methylophaga nitratireducenticrescens TaxID=754476 RepID=I1XJN8_METNJ|nr:CHASE2 domain-containing protein [Methylophaga nitratireducenticrescens]AFI84607.1 hypothetical protein Q7A_1789 [Methylophaga nitratireducenticrescens]AUZ84622.1 hypothetical protein CDW43_08540 [Methylophaga nitratireducenticrescens]